MDCTEASLARRPLPFVLARAAKHYRSCRLCEHRCAVDRSAGELGRCRADAVARVFRHRVEYGDETELTPSHVFYLSGCDLRCVYCIAEENAFDPTRGVVLDGAFLRQAVADGRARGARNLQWLGGEATIHLPAILSAMAECDDLPPIVWKSNFHMTPEVFDLLDGVVDLFLADFKFGDDRCAQALGGGDDYIEIVTRNLKHAARLRADGVDLIVRHLVLPNHVDCCARRIIDWTADHLPDVKFSLRGGYLPAWR
ncbi:MAG: radical SAM protein, partial [Planctomycetia bacterium]